MNQHESRTPSIREGRSDAARERTGATSGPAKSNEIEPLLHPAHVAKLLNVSPSWLAKSRLNGTGPRFIKIGRAVRYGQSAVREYILSRQRVSTAER
jgi:predicted DNA-binding transcriptional regulator AlpA